MCSPIPRIIKKGFPNAEIHFICKKSFRTLLESDPHIDKVWDYESLDFGELKATSFDQVIDLHNNLRSRKIRNSFDCPKQIVNKENFNKWLLTTFKIDRLPNKHVVDRYVETIAGLGLSNDNLGLNFYIEKDNTPSEHLNSLPKEYSVLVIGAAHATKSLTLQKYNELVAELEGHIVLIGGEKDRLIADQLLVQNKNITSLCGLCSLQESAQVIEGSRVVVTPDTGMMHIAAALKKPTVVLWGNTTPRFGMGPYYGQHKVPTLSIQVDGLSCRPCSKIGHTNCPKKHFDCINQLDFTPLKKWLGDNLPTNDS